METVCPCCGQIVDVELPLVDLNTNSVSYDHLIVQLPLIAAEILLIIIKRYPATATYHEISKALWGNYKPGNPTRNIHVHVHWLRQAIEPFPFRIKNIVDIGFRLVWTRVSPQDGSKLIHLGPRRGTFLRGP